jgi:hypothetical protein
MTPAAELRASNLAHGVVEGVISVLKLLPIAPVSKYLPD